MKRGQVLLFCHTVAALALAAGCSPSQTPEPQDQGAAKAETANVRRGPAGEITVTVEPATQRTMGLETAELAAVTVAPEVKGYGRVLDGSILASQVVEIVSTDAAARVSQAELERLRTLVARNNASERALQAAEGATARDQALAQAARLKLLSTWGQAVAQQENLTEWVAQLVSLKRVLVQIDLPATSAAVEQPVLARLELLSGPVSGLAARLLGRAPVADPQFQARSFLFVVDNGGAQLVPGLAVTGFLAVPGEPQSGVLVPAAALVRVGGGASVYLQTEPGRFQRTGVDLARPAAGGWVVMRTLKPGQRVVTAGAQQLLSVERREAGEE